MTVAAVTLDVTGTMIHSPRLAEIYASVLTRHGLEVDAPTIGPVIEQVWQEFDCQVALGQERFGEHPQGAVGWWRRFMERVAEHLDRPSPGRFAAAELYDRFAHADAWEIYPDVLPALSKLCESWRLVVLSNWDPRLPTLLERLALAPFFEEIVYSAAIGAEKPHAAIFDIALDRLELGANRVVHVGDRSKDDVEGATAVGMHALLLDRDGQGDLATLTDLPDAIRDLDTSEPLDVA